MNCMICMEKLESENSSSQKNAKILKTTMTTCNHHFHVECLHKWYNKNKKRDGCGTCPLCRTYGFDYSAFDVKPNARQIFLNTLMRLFVPKS